MKIFVVDDNDTVRTMVTSWLEIEYGDCTIKEIEDGRVALEEIRKEKPDLVILDNMLPGLRGLELLKIVKEEDNTVPIILFSAFGAKEILEQAIDFGVDAFIDKPLDFKKFRRKIESVLSKYQLIKENAKLKEDLKRSEQNYRHLIEDSRDGIFRVDQSGRVIFSNKKILEWTGMSLEELIGKEFQDLNIDEESSIKYSTKSDGFLYETQIISKNGRKYILEVSARWIKEEGKIEGMEGVARDITSRRQLEKELSKQKIQLEAILNSIDDGILAYDFSKEIISVNKVIEKMIGHLDLEIVGKSIEELEPMLYKLVKDPEVLHKALRNVEKEPYDFTDIEVVSKRDKKIFKMKGFPILDRENNFFGRVLVFHDITMQRFMERMKEDLSSMIVHDLKNPISAILMYTEILALEVQEPRHKDFLKKVKATSNELLRMIMDLLDVHKMEEGKMILQKEKFELNKTLKKAYDQVAFMKDVKKLKVQFELEEKDHSLIGDEDRIFRVMVNLIGNAIKFTPTGGAIKLKIWADQSDRNIFFSVADTGVGIPKEYQDRIFDKFVQVESRKEGQKFSTGLGLTYCKLAVEAHRGEIWFDSLEGKGSTFLVRLPF